MTKKKFKKKLTIQEDMDKHKVQIPFDLFTGLSLVVKELGENNFKYSHLIKEEHSVLIFNNEKSKEKINIYIEKETLLIRQFDVSKEPRKLTVIYVVKPSERKFSLVKPRPKKIINNNLNT